MFKKPKIYSSVDNCPIGIFNKVLETKDYNLLCYNGKAKPQRLLESFKIIYDEYLKLFGIPDQFKRYSIHMRKAGELYLESIKKGKEWKKITLEACLASSNLPASSKGVKNRGSPTMSEI